MTRNRVYGGTLILAGIVVLVLVWLGARSEPEPIEVPILPVIEELEEPEELVEVIGQSVEGRDILAYTYGEGDTHLVFVGGIHGGYEWNSVLLAYEYMDHLRAAPESLPDNMQVTIVPDANPDGTFRMVGKEGRFVASEAPQDRDDAIPGRLNANDVDLNRNFDCKWQPEAVWRGQEVSAGSAAFSEPEARALRDFALKHTPDAFIFWHSRANNVYASECEEGILPETLDITRAYANAADYGVVEVFDAYPVTGDAEGWLASIGIPAITVELETHADTEWERNIAGVEALYEYYSAAR